VALVPDGRRDVRSSAPPRGAARTVRLGDADVDLAALDALLCPSLTRGVAAALGEAAARLATGGPADLASLVAALDADVDARGLDALAPWAPKPGGLARPRRQEVAAAINRVRTLVVAAGDGGGTA
jgi:hypothetical protein